MKKRVVAVICAMLMAAVAVSGCGKKADTEKTNIVETEKTDADVEKVTPTLMYFVSNSDASFDEENAVITELENEYGDKVNFNVINIDENTEAASNFPVQGNTPAVIMLNTTNDISAMDFQCYDKAQLEEIIKAAME